MTDEMRPTLHDLHGALRMALPVMRRTAWEYFSSVTVKGNPATICLAEWREIAPDVRAIMAAELCVGPQPDMEIVDTVWLNACIAAAPVWVRDGHDE